MLTWGSDGGVEMHENVITVRNIWMVPQVE